MKREAFIFSPASRPSDEACSMLDRCADLSAAILEQDLIIDREMEHVLSCGLEFDLLRAIAEHLGSSPYLWDICNATSAASSTAHRQMTGMIDRSLLQRLPQSSDRRRVAVRLSAGAKAMLERKLDLLDQRAN